MKITRVSLQSKLDEGYMSTVKSVHPVSIAVKHSLFYRRIRANNDISSSNFDCNENGVIIIEEYVSIVRSVHPTSCPQTDSLPAFHPSTRRKSPQQSPAFHPLDPRNPQPRVLPATHAAPVSLKR